MNDKTGGPAFPSGLIDPSTPEDAVQSLHNGMTLRDYFAAHAPEPPAAWRGGDCNLKDILDWRWWYADAMMKARNA